MLKDSFFKVLNLEAVEGSVKAELELNASHVIFDGHFPGTPVVPGVCMMQMVKEMLEVHEGEKLQVSRADSMKFLSVIDPRIDKVIQLVMSIQTGDMNIGVVATIAAGERVCFKFKGSFKLMEPAV